MSTDKAGEARKGLLDTVTGKAKEMAGALTNKDDLVEEGQLQQADARARKEAASQDAIADANRAKASEELRESTQDVIADKRDARAEAAHRVQAVQHDAAAQKAAAGRDAHKQELADRSQAEVDADAEVDASQSEAARLTADAANAERHAGATQHRFENKADDAERRAAQLRAEARN